MSSTRPVLHLMCGKIASGKSTLSARLARSGGGVVIAEDDWLKALYPDGISDMADYLRYMSQLRNVMAPHVVALLKAGVSVVLDFQANTIASRAWMRGILDQIGAAHQMHVLDVPDEICLARLQARNAQGDHPFAATQAEFQRISKHFQPPTAQEGFTVVWHDGHGLG